MRIVSLTCSNTEIVWALGKADWLVGVDDYSDFPPRVVGSLPRVGPDLGIDIDAVARLAPDLVLASLTVPGHERVVEELERSGLPYIAPAPESLADTYRDVLDIAARLGVPDAGATLIARMQGEIASCHGTAAALQPPAENGAPTRPAVLVEWWPKPVFVPGGRSWVTDLLTAVGARNPFQDAQAKSLAVDDEQVRAVDPAAIVVSWCGVDPAKYRLEKVYERSGWAATRAVRNRHVYAVDEAYLGRPGPRLTEGARRLAEIVRRCSGNLGDGLGRGESR